MYAIRSYYEFEDLLPYSIGFGTGDDGDRIVIFSFFIINTFVAEFDGYSLVTGFF